MSYKKRLFALLTGMRFCKVMAYKEEKENCVFFRMQKNPQPDFVRAAQRILLGQVGDTPRAPMKGFLDATNTVILN